MEVARRTGVVRKYFEDRGFGFVRLLLTSDIQGKAARIDVSHPDVFVHHRELRSAGLAKVEIGDVLEFDVLQSDKGFLASRIRLVQ
jgi:cold shock CspA family protein